MSLHKDDGEGRFEQSKLPGLRVMFAGASTGGHLMPGVATAQALADLWPGARSLFLITERRIVQECLGALSGFETERVPGTPWGGLRAKLTFAPRCARAAVQVGLLMRRFRPHVVVGLGSYNSVVPILLARAAGTPTVLFEGNARPGRLVRALAPLADCVALQWAEAARWLATRHAVELGNPIRSGLTALDRAGARRRLGLEPDRCTLLALGGSQGALAVSRLLWEALPLVRADVQVLHLTGPDHVEEARRSAPADGPLYRPVGFTTDMADPYAAADFVLARAGASTLAELTALGLPSVLVPYPYHSDRHQYRNAAILARAGAAVAVDQWQLTPARLAGLIDGIASNAEHRRRMAESARRLGRPQAARCVARRLIELSGLRAGVGGLPPALSDVRTGYPQAA